MRERLRAFADRVERVPVLGRVVSVVEELVEEWQADRVNGLAAEVAFFAILSVFPGLLALAAALGSLEAVVGADVADRVREAVLGAVRAFLATNEQTRGLVSSVEGLFHEQSSGLLTVGLVTAVWSASRGTAALIRALDLAYDLEERRSWLDIRLRALALAVGSVLTSAVMLTMLVVGPLLGRGPEVADLVGLGEVFAVLWDWFRPPLAFALLVGWAATVFHFAPNHHTPWRWDLPGAVLASVLWVLLSLAFRLYLDVAAGANEVFGTLGGALVALVWLYLVSIALLVGGEVNAILVQRHELAVARRGLDEMLRSTADSVRAAMAREEEQEAGDE